MGLFRRTPKGKHALGAAVTSIPSGPLLVAAPLAAAARPAPEPVADVPAEPSVMTSIAELIATGDAWATDLEDFHALHTPEPVAAVDPVPAAPEALPVVDVAAAATYAAPPQPVFEAAPLELEPLPLLAPLPAAVVQPVAVQPFAEEPSARASLEAALADLLPSQPTSAAEAYAPPAAPRVQLGFRDGTSASLDPDSEQALALELLAQSLTRRD